MNAPDTITHVNSDAITPVDPNHCRKVLDPWVLKAMSKETPEWIKIEKKEIHRLHKKVRARSVKAVLGLSDPLERWRTSERVHDEYNRIWGSHHWYQPGVVPPGKRPNLVLWENERLLLSPGGMKQMQQERLVRAVALIKPKSALEIGFGVGSNLFTLGAVFPDIALAGIELSDAGTAVAKSVQQEQILPEVITSFCPAEVKDPTAHRRIDLRQADATKLPFADNSFDLVYSRLALEQMELVRDAALSEMVRVSRRWIVMIEPFADFNNSDLLRLSMKAKNYFSASIADLGTYGMTPQAMFSRWPQKLKEGVGMVCATVP